MTVYLSKSASSRRAGGQLVGSAGQVKVGRRRAEGGRRDDVGKSQVLACFSAGGSLGFDLSSAHRSLAETPHLCDVTGAAYGTEQRDDGDGGGRR